MIRHIWVRPPPYEVRWPLLRIRNIQPGSTVGVWRSDGDKLGEELFLAKVEVSEVIVHGCPKGPVMIRVRKKGILPFQLQTEVAGEGLDISTIAIRDEMYDA